MLLSCFLDAVVLLVPHPVPDDRAADFAPRLDIISRKKIQDALRGELTRCDLIEEAIQQ
jgi:hypothetical protein